MSDYFDKYNGVVPDRVVLGAREVLRIYKDGDEEVWLLDCGCYRAPHQSGSCVYHSGRFGFNAMLEFEFKIRDDRIAELEFLRDGAESARLKDNEYLLGKIAAYEGVLDLIAAGERADGTYNRSREACEQLAKEVLAVCRATV